MSDYFLVLVPKEPRFTKGQIQTAVDIYLNVGLILLGSVAFPIAIGNGSTLVFIAGLVGTSIFWYLAFIIAKGIT